MYTASYRDGDEPNRVEVGYNSSHTEPKYRTGGYSDDFRGRRGSLSVSFSSTYSSCRPTAGLAPGTNNFELAVNMFVVDIDPNDNFSTNLPLAKSNCLNIP